MTSSHQATSVQFHPDAPRPRFPWRASLPSSWIYLNTHPDSSKFQTQLIAENYIPGHRFSRSEQKLIVRQLEETISAARKSKVLLALIQPGVDSNGQPTAATLLLRWYDSSPDYASLATVKEAMSNQTASAHTEVTECTTPQSVAYLMTSRVQNTGSITERRQIFHQQAFLPLPASTWTLVISGSTPDADSNAAMRDIVIRITNSVGVLDEQSLPAPTDVSSADDALLSADETGGEIESAQNTKEES